MAIVQTHPLLPILLRRLRIVFRVMSERWEKYTIAYRNGGALDPTSSTHLSALKAHDVTWGAKVLARLVSGQDKATKRR